MGEDTSMWVGKDEHEGVRAQPRKDLKPPPHWRLEAIAYTPRPRSLAIGPDRRQATFIQDGDTSEVWLLDLGHDGGAPERLTTGRELMPYWEDTTPKLSPDGAHVAYADGDHVWIAPTAGGPPRKLAEGAEPVWIDADRLVFVVEREDTGRLAVLRIDDPWPQRLATEHGGLEAYGDEEAPQVSPDGTEVAYVFGPRADLNRSEIRVARIDGGEARALTGTPRMHDRGAVWAPDGETLAYVSERSGFYEVHLVTRDGSGERQLTSVRADHSELDWHPDGDRLLAVRGRGNRFGLVALDADSGDAETLASGGLWSEPFWTAGGDLVGCYEDHATPSELRRLTPAEEPRPVHAPAPKTVRNAPHAELVDVTYTSFDGLEIPAFLMRPENASAENPAPAVVYPHGGPTMCYADEWDGHAQYFVERGIAWLAINFRGSTGYGRDFERKNHGDWGVGDTKDCLAAADHLRSLDWIDGRPPRDLRRELRLLPVAAVRGRRPRAPFPLRGPEVRRLRHRDLLGAGRPLRRAGPRADDGPSRGRARGVPRRLGLPPAREHRSPAPDRPRRTGRTGEPEAVGAARRAAARAGQDVRVRDLPHGGPRPPAGGTAAGLLPATGPLS